MNGVDFATRFSASDRPDLSPYERTQTSAPLNPTIGLRPERRRIRSAHEWSTLSNNLYNMINSAISARQPLETNLAAWRDAYAMVALQKDFPFVDSSNLRTPFTAGQVESLVAYICGQVIVPRLFMVTGNTPQAAQTAHLVEQFYNADFVRIRPDGSSYYQALIDYFHLALRDGTAYMEILWNRKQSRIPVWNAYPRPDDQGMPTMGPDGKPVYDHAMSYVDTTSADYPDWRAVPLKDFLILPVTSRSHQQALGVARALWPFESQLDALVRSGFLDSNEVEKALTYVTSGSNEVSSDRQGYYDKDASHQLDVGIGVTTQSGKVFRNRGPLKIWRVHTNAYDMDDDGEPEENVFFVHELSQRCLGWMPYDYPTELRPYFEISPFPRPDEAIGFSLIERLAGVQMEMDSEHNARQDRRAMTLFPPFFVKQGDELASKGLDFGPGKMNEVSSNNKADPTIAFMDIPDASEMSFQEETLLRQYGTEYTGLNMPAVGAQSSGRRSATEMRQQSTATGTRLGLIEMRLRVAIGQMIAFTHMLNKQYRSQPPTTIVGNQQFSLPLEVLAQDYYIGVTGATDPLDSVTRRSETLAFVQLAMNFPEFQGDAVRRFYLLRMICEAYNRADTAQLIGTEQDAQQRQQQEQQAQQKQQQMIEQAQQAAIAQGKPPPMPGQQGGGGGHKGPHH